MYALNSYCIVFGSFKLWNALVMILLCDVSGRESGWGSG